MTSLFLKFSLNFPGTMSKRYLEDYFSSFDSSISSFSEELNDSISLSLPDILNIVIGS